MQITVLGASGKVGQLVVRLCLERGYQVVALVHSHDPFGGQTGLTVVTGDIYQSSDVAAALQGSEAVISTLGSWHTKHKNVLESATKLVIPAMSAFNIKRIITVTGNAALWSDDKPNFIIRASRAMLSLIAPKILSDGEAHIAMLAESDLDWTCLRSPVMTKQSHTDYRLLNKLSLGVIPIPRVAVATALVDQLENRDWVRQAPVLYRR